MLNVATQYSPLCDGVTLGVENVVDAELFEATFDTPALTVPFAVLRTKATAAIIRSKVYGDGCLPSGQIVRLLQRSIIVAIDYAFLNLGVRVAVALGRSGLSGTLAFLDPHARST